MSDSREFRRKKLDDAIREYFTLGQEEKELPDNHFITGWVLGIATSGYDEEQETDNLLIESSPGINNYMASGIATATNRGFMDQMLGI